MMRKQSLALLLITSILLMTVGVFHISPARALSATPDPNAQVYAEAFQNLTGTPNANWILYENYTSFYLYYIINLTGLNPLSSSLTDYWMYDNNSGGANLDLATGNDGLHFSVFDDTSLQVLDYTYSGSIGENQVLITFIPTGNVTMYVDSSEVCTANLTGASFETFGTQMSHYYSFLDPSCTGNVTITITSTTVNASPSPPSGGGGGGWIGGSPAPLKNNGGSGGGGGWNATKAINDLLNALRKIPPWALWALIAILLIVGVSGVLNSGKKKKRTPSRSFNQPILNGGIR
jgi:uncharacterized membrane protein YgcG